MKNKIAALGVLLLITAIFSFLLLNEKKHSAALNEELSGLKLQNISKGDEISKIKDQMSIIKDERDKLAKDRSNLEQQLSNALNNKSQLEVSIKGSEELISTLRIENEALRADANRLKDGLSVSGKKIDELTAQLNEANNKLQQTQSTLTGNAEASEQNYTNCPNCPNVPDTEKIIAEAARLKLEVSKTEAELSGLRQQLARDHNRLSEMKRDLALLASEKEAAQSEAKTAKEAYDKLSHDLKSLISSKDLVISDLQDKLSLTFMDKIFFPTGSATLTADGMRVLDSVSEALRGLKDKKIMVIGHTDDQPIAKSYQRIFPSNWELSAARASAVIRYFQEKGSLSPDVLEAVGRAFYSPVAPNDSPENRQKNRRVEIIVSNK